MSVYSDTYHSFAMIGIQSFYTGTIRRKANVDMIICDEILQEVLKNLESHRQTFQQIHRDRSVNGVPVPPEQLQDMAER